MLRVPAAIQDEVACEGERTAAIVAAGELFKDETAGLLSTIQFHPVDAPAAEALVGVTVPPGCVVGGLARPAEVHALAAMATHAVEIARRARLWVWTVGN